MDDKALLRTFAADKKTKKLRLPLPSVQLVCLWALVNAFSVVVSFTSTAIIPVTCSPSSWLFPCIKETVEQAMEVHALVIRILWCAAPQMAAAVALLLPRRRRRCRWSLAFVALAGTGAMHFLIARVILIFLAAEPGYLLMRIVAGFDYIYAAFDIVGFLVLLMGGEEEDK
ncbi:hypothetical protein EJB05_38560 [Eragrostis curvula]|uniref:PGG domain-containing protein n=1 Tax=Eragrostis curvula TaxID=38414 RepID=A0A5J9TW61_9POAL|nr:hypothetical protein EJB05_38560 [Eragrostis curvula]